MYFVLHVTSGDPVEHQVATKICERRHQRWVPLLFTCKMEISCGFVQMDSEPTYATSAFAAYVFQGK